MDAPIKDLERARALLATAQAHLCAGRAAEAEQAALEAEALDPNYPKTADVRAEISRALGHAELAAGHAARAKLLREQAWKRAVEAEARGHHDLMGEATRREVP